MTARMYFLLAFGVFVAAIAGSTRAQLFEDEECHLASGAVGRCKETEDCPQLISLIASGRRPIICSFKQTKAIVCCPLNASLPSLASVPQTPNRKGQTRPATSAPTLASTPDDSCTLKNGTKGECKAIQDCSAYNSITVKFSPEICYFQRVTPIVCCPRMDLELKVNAPSPGEQRRTTHSPVVVRTTTVPTTTPVAGRTSEEMCVHYSQFVYVMIQSPTLFIVPEWHNESQCSVDVRKNSSQRRMPIDARHMEFPHVTRLGYGNNTDILWNCAGSLISDNYILTADRCLTSPNSGRVRWARLGDMKPTLFSPDTQPIQRIVDWLVPETVPAGHNTIALLRLEKYATFSGNVRPACLYTRLENPLGYRFATTVGWGMVDWDDTTTSVKLMKQNLAFTSTENCNEVNGRRRRRRQAHQRQYKSTAQAGAICMLNPSQQDTSCVGGLGSPLHVVLESPYCMYSILGVNTAGQRGCASSSNPGAFTRVADHIDWIESHIWG